MEADTQRFLECIAYRLRVDCLRATTQAGSGHLTSCLSAADIVAVLFFHALRFDLDDHNNPCNDRFILSKGHAAPLVYAVWHQLGKISEAELLTLRQFDSPLEGHPTPRFVYNEAATGSLGQGLSIGLGMALAAKADNLPCYTYVLLGDSECAEGSVWEAAELAAHYNVDNLIAFVDLNRLGQSTETLDGHNANKMQKKFEAFGWQVLTCNGHDIAEIVESVAAAQTRGGKPVVIIATTYKGYGLDVDIENQQGFHGKAMPPEKLQFYLNKLKERFLGSVVQAHDHYVPLQHVCAAFQRVSPRLVNLPAYQRHDEIATRKAYGEALVALGRADERVVVLDAEVKNSTFAELFETAFSERFYQCFIAEQNMVSMGVGMAARGKVPFVSTFAAFLTRAHDQLRMAAIGKSPLRVCGSHAGVAIGEDGPSQMGLEDLGLMRALPESIIFYPCDAVSTHKCVELMAGYQEGVSYLRTTRGATPVIYSNNEMFTIGGCKLLRWSSNDRLCIVAAGVTLFEALKAYDRLQSDGISVRVIDCYAIKPLPVEELLEAARGAGNRVITVEDHYLAGGLGEAVCAALAEHGIAVTCLAVKKLPRSGKPEELLAYEEIDADAIVKAVTAHIE